MKILLRVVFTWSLVVAVVLGVMIVLGQAIGLMLHSDTWLLASKSYFAKTAYIASGIAGISAFLASYLSVD